MGTVDRRKASRWKASTDKYRIELLRENGSWSTATILDISKAGIGVRAEGHSLKVGRLTRLRIDLEGERVEVAGLVRFVDTFTPRVGLQIDATGAMESVLRYVERNDFMMTEVIGDTLVVKGVVTFVTGNTFDATRGYQKVDLSAVREISMGGVYCLSKMAQAGVKISSCSEAIAPRLESMGICRGAWLCVADKPCDLPKTWPVSEGFLARHGQKAAAGDNA